MNAGRQQGFTYVAILIFIALAGLGLAFYGELTSHTAQREKEAELLFRGNAMQQAIASYFKKEGRYPPSLDSLLEDRRYPMPVRHLRRLYPDPMNPEGTWALVEAPGGGGVMGIHSRSERAPIKTGNFPTQNQGFEKAKTYADWKFIHSPAKAHSPPGLQAASQSR